MLRKRSRRVRLDRLQAVDVVRPLVARALGLAELRLEVAGGSSSEAPLAYLSEDAAQRLRAELLARAAGLHHATPEAPEAVLLEVPLGRLVEATAAVGRADRHAGVAGLPGRRHRGHRRVVAARASRCRSAWRSCPIIGRRRGAALRLHGGRVAGRPPAPARPAGDPRRRPCRRAGCRRCGWSSRWLWRSQGWCRVEVDVAGYVGEGQAAASVLCPVAPAGRGAGPARPGAAGGRRRRGAADRRTGVGPCGWTRSAGGRSASAPTTGCWSPAPAGSPGSPTWCCTRRCRASRLRQGPLQRRLGLASVHLDTTPGPVNAIAAHRAGRRGAGRWSTPRWSGPGCRAPLARPDRWMSPPSDRGSTYCDAVTSRPERRARPRPGRSRLRRRPVPGAGAAARGGAAGLARADRAVAGAHLRGGQRPAARPPVRPAVAGQDAGGGASSRSTCCTATR